MTQTFILAAGGTGGHVFPAEALAEELIFHGHRVVLVTDKRFKAYGGTLASVDKRIIRAGTMGRGMVNKVTALFDIGLGLVQARNILKEIKPVAVIGFGGYPSFPTVKAACMLGIPTIIHEQNSVLGRANRMLAAKVDAIALSFPRTERMTDETILKSVCIGNPVRQAIRALYDVPYPELTDKGAIRILVTGGSQGAFVFSQILPQAVASLPAAIRQRLRIDQQCREQDLSATRSAYEMQQVNADLASFFVDMPVRIASAHLVIARAGASTVFELAAAGRPAILVPLPTSMDNHQHFNATALEEAGGAWLIPQEGFTVSAVAARLESLVRLPSKLKEASDGAKSMARIYAAKELAKLVMHVASKGSVKQFQEKAAEKSSATLMREQAA